MIAINAQNNIDITLEPQEIELPLVFAVPVCCCTLMRSNMP